MSTKIYTGFRLPHCTLEQAFLKLQKFKRDTLLPAAQVACHRVLVGEAVRLMDDVACGVAETPSGTSYWLVAAWSNLLDRVREIRQTGRRDPAVDFDFEVVLFPAGSDILGISFSEQSELQQLWLAERGVEDFAYWNNTDRPDDVSESEWELREQAWDRVLPYGGAPSEHGLSMVLCRSDKLLTERVTEVSGLLPSFTERTRRVSRELLANKWDAETQAGPGDTSMAVLRRFRKWTESEEGRLALAKTEARVSGILRADVTLDLLRGK